MSLQQVTLGFGKANLPVTLASIACFRVQAPFVRDSAANSGKTVRAATRDYSIGIAPDFGSLYSRLVEHKQGEVLLLQSGWKRRGASIRDGAIFLRLRDGAPKWSIIAKLPTEAQNLHGAEFEVFNGFADMLNVEDLESFGMEVPNHYRSKFMSAEEVDECFILRQELPERLPRPGLMRVMEGGKEKVVEVAKAPARRMRLGRR